MMGWLLNRGRLLADRKKLGRWGEKRCESFLKKKGFKRLARNFSCKSGEIDLDYGRYRWGSRLCRGKNQSK